MQKTADRTESGRGTIREDTKKNNVLKILSAALILCIALTACGNPEEERPVVVTRDPNVPANLVTDPPATAEPEPTAMTEPEAAPESETTEAVTEPAPETEPPATPAPETTAEETETVEDDPNVPDTRAMDCLRLFNSKKVHAKYIAAALSASHCARALSHRIAVSSSAA